MIMRRKNTPRTAATLLPVLARLGAGAVGCGDGDGSCVVGPGRAGGGRPATGFITVRGRLASGEEAAHHGVVVAVSVGAGAGAGVRGGGAVGLATA